MDMIPEIAKAAAAEPATAPLNEREQRIADAGTQALFDEYRAAFTDVRQNSADGVGITKRYFQRYALVQEKAQEAVRQAGDKLACGKGCAYCCHNRVVAPAHELMTLADTIQAMPEAQRAVVMERVARNAERIESMDAATQFRTPIRCALLGDDNACMAYDDRPSNCRRYHSLRLKDCETSFFQPENLNSRIRLSTPLLIASTAQYLGFRRVLADRGVDTANYEMNTALREALSDPQACSERYGSGKGAFAHAVRYDDELPKP
jgi:Fe-S-cluster containining protein